MSETKETTSEKRELSDLQEEGQQTAETKEDAAESSPPAAKKLRVDNESPKVEAAPKDDDSETKKEADKKEETPASVSGDELKLDEPDEVDGLDDVEESKDESSSAREELKTKTIVIFGLPVLPTASSEEKLNAFLSKFGSIKELSVKSAFASRYCKCEYDEVGHAQKAFDTLNGRRLMGKQLFVKPV